VSDYLPQIVDMIESLRQKGIAYQAGDSVYYRVNAFSSYNKFAGADSATEANLSSTDAVVSVANDSRSESKSSFRDFALWKSSGRTRLGTPPVASCSTEALSETELVERGLAWKTSLGCGRPGSNYDNNS
jgi:cysteinyl-tRNA synthetase